MSMIPDLENQQPPEISEASISECQRDVPGASQSKCPVNQDTRQESNQPQNQETTAFPGPSGNTRTTRPIPKTKFGLKQTTIQVDPSLAYDPIAATYDYTKKYKPDPMYYEADENARVWHVYNDEAAIFDADMIEEASDSLDILLVFAGLFSAILTTFVVQTSQSLGPDNSELTVALLQEMVNLQRAQAKGIFFELIPQAKSSGPSNIDRWVNGLWFASLTLSLSSALLAVLIKQWLRYYRSRITGSSRRRALIRQFRYDGFEKWQVQPIIGVLPTVLHLALFLFLIGLVLFLITLDTAISIVIGATTALLMTIYVVSIALPIIMLHCPYRTPVSDLIHRLFVYGISLKQREGNNILRRANSACVALCWLFVETSNQSVFPIIAESVSAVWRSEYGFESGITLQSTDTKLWIVAKSCFYILHRQVLGSFLSNQLKFRNGDWTQFSPEQSKELQQALLYCVICHDTSFYSFEKDELKKVTNNEITALSSNPVIGLLALSVGFSVRFKGDGESDSGDNAMSVESKKPFTWLLNHHSKLAMPKLHPAVWKELQKREGWKVEGITQENMSADFKGLMKESWDLKKTQNYAQLHQPVSLALFVLEGRILDMVMRHLFGYDWSWFHRTSEVEQWLTQPVVQADENLGGLEYTEGSEGVRTPEVEQWLTQSVVQANEDVGGSEYTEGSEGVRTPEVEQWLTQSVVQANEDVGGSDYTEGNEGVIPEGQATHPSI